MFEIKNPSKKIKSILEELGHNYEIKVIDAEQCIYRNLQNGYDIEVSGLNNQKQSIEANIYVWDCNKGSRIVDRVQNVTSLDELKEKLEELSIKYS
ncbi:hypothetical protein FJQ98_02835 [Lysinibacillus agricola]|uniref:Uncharacterized protein n=1 Tax=Lysinibacillus agricola TaxID=2590012 RepID=A0ABX7AT95_9BACI|nr:MULTISPECIES: hypothetical protein [Lysinibacillus]KOS61704.1 hypothetical protein AN161_16155 [Lysinibacillus sp. FJAT-14222]QQP13026.1 hypothetical protein FJQ98_02835 [Lysinibacillus agricola]